MTLLGFWGFEDHIPDAGSFIGNWLPGRTGGGCSGCSGYSTTAEMHFAEIAPAQEFIVGFAVFLNTVQRSNLDIGYYDAASGVHNVHVSLYTTGHDPMAWQLQHNGTVIWTGNLTLSQLWYYMEIKIKVDPVNGSIELRENGRVIHSYTGNTQAGADGDTNYMSYGAVVQNVVYMDDVYLLDTTGADFNDYLGDIVVKQVVPGGNGSSSEFVNSAGTSVNNYSYVNAQSSQSATYVQAPAAGDTDLYDVAPLTISDIPLAIQSLTYAQKTDGGASPNMAPISKGVLGTLRTDDTLNLSATTYQNLPGTVYTTDPDGNELTSAAVNGMQIGVVSQ